MKTNFQTPDPAVSIIFFRIWASSIWKVDEMADFTIAEAITNDGAKACSV
jgi:hypothetical protein